jgi:hypothetical protein
MAESFEIVVTDVTIYGKLRCVAGWDIKRKQMIRPEPKAGEFWPALVCGRNTTFDPGHLVRFNAEKPITSFPHQSEDWVVKGEPAKRKTLTGEEFKTVLDASLSMGPQKTFGKSLKNHRTSAYVIEGTNCGSLCGMEIDRKDLMLVKKSDGDAEKPRVKLELGGIELDLSIAAKDLRQAFDRDGLKAIKEKIDSSKLHLRLGLARALDHSSGERRCYLQVNGIYPV